MIRIAVWHIAVNDHPNLPHAPHQALKIPPNIPAACARPSPATSAAARQIRLLLPRAPHHDALLAAVEPHPVDPPTASAARAALLLGAVAHGLAQDAQDERVHVEGLGAAPAALLLRRLGPGLGNGRDGRVDHERGGVVEEVVGRFCWRGRVVQLAARGGIFG